MRHALIWGGVASFILTAALILAMPKGGDSVTKTVDGGGVPFILGELPSGLQDLLLLLIIFAFFSCGTSVQGAGSRLAFSYARDGALPASSWVSKVSSRFGTPINALVVGAVVSSLFVLLVFASPTKDLTIGFITYPANVNALVALVSFGVSGIYLSFLLTVIGAIVASTVSVAVMFFCSLAGFVVAGVGGAFSMNETCPACGGRQLVYDEPCPTCHGSGRGLSARTIQARIPAGVKDGQKIRLRGKGQPGEAGAALAKKVGPRFAPPRRAPQVLHSILRSRSPCAQR